MVPSVFHSYRLFAGIVNDHFKVCGVIKNRTGKFEIFTYFRFLEVLF